LTVYRNYLKLRVELGVYDVDGEQLQYESCNYAMQQDAVNCGVYVSWYAFQLVRNLPLTSSFDPLTFRYFMASVLLRNARQSNKESQKHCDIGCSISLCSDEVVHWMQCTICGRWEHLFCSSNKNSPPSADQCYICPFCVSNHN
jgi:hypothetical protein